MNDLTHGSPARRLLGFFFPLLCTNLLQQAYTVADTLIVGKGLGDYALGAVGNLSSFIFLINGFLMGMTGGFSVIIGQCFGKGDRPLLRRSIAHSAVLTIGITILLTALPILLLPEVLHLLKTPETIFRDSEIYGRIVFAGLPAAAAYSLCSGVLRSLGDSRTPMKAIIISSLINIVLDWVLIFWFRAGVEAAAYATIFAQIVSTVICLVKIGKTPEIRLQREDFSPDSRMVASLMKNGFPGACMHAITAAGNMAVQGFVNGLGALYTSAFSVSGRIISIFMLPSITAGSTVSVFTSQNSGAGEGERVYAGLRISVLIALAAWIPVAVALGVFPEVLAGFILNEKEAVQAAAEYLRICGPGMIMLNLLFVYRGCVQGMGRPMIPMLSGVLEMLLRLLTLAVFLSGSGFRTAAYAELLAWGGALVMNLIACLIHMRKLRKD